MGTGNKNLQRILITDDNELNRALLAEMLEQEYEIMEASNGIEAVKLLHQYNSEIDLVLLDIVMPEMDGFGVLTMMNKYHWIEDIPVIIITMEDAPAYMEKAYELGVTDFIKRPLNEIIIKRRVVNTLLLYGRQKKLVGLVTNQIIEREKSNSLLINILSHIVEFRNGESGLHVLHINMMTDMILKHLQRKTDKYRMSSSEIAMIATASALHDIGKIGIPDEVLNKPGKFTPEEFEIMKGHSALGASMLEKIPYQEEEPLVKAAYAICRWHHERYDGKGYPDGLVGEQIPIEAQVVALADVYDALTSERVYKKAILHEKAVQMILNGECGAFNPILLECLVDIADNIQEELRVNSFNRTNQRQMANVASELLRHEELSASDRTLRLLENERTKYRFFASMSKEIQFEYTVAPPMVQISDWGAEMLGLNEITMDPYHDRQILENFGEENLNEMAQALRATTPESPVLQFDYRIKVHGQERWNKIICRAMWSGEPAVYTGVIGKVVDIQQEKEKLSSLEFLATHDGLTGLLNLRGAKDQIIEKLENDEMEFALVIFDLDYFKKANDTWGHDFGNKVLQYVAKKLHQSIRGGDVAARVGGDEILVFLPYKNDGLKVVVTRIFNALSGDFEGFNISLSMGVARTEDVGRDYETLFRHADQALYAAKRGGRGQLRFYEEEMDQTSSVISPIEG